MLFLPTLRSWQSKPQPQRLLFSVDGFAAGGPWAAVLTPPVPAPVSFAPAAAAAADGSTLRASRT